MTIVARSGLATAEAVSGGRVPVAANVAPPSVDVNSCSPFGLAHRPTSQTATRSLALDAASTAGPTTSRQAGCQVRHMPASSVAPPDTMRSFSRTQPDEPDSSSSIRGTGPAPTGTRTAATRQSSAPTRLDPIRKSWAASYRTACTVPADVSSAVTVAPAGNPLIVRRPHVAPPSCVAHSSGPNAQPFNKSAKRRDEIPAPPAWTLPRTPPLSVVFGASIDDQVAPPSTVRMIAGHRAPPQGTLPRTQPLSAETKVADCGSKSAGTGSPAGVGDGVATTASLGDTWADGSLDPTLVGCPGVAEGDPPTVDGLMPGRTIMAKTAMATAAASRAKPDPDPRGDRLGRTPWVRAEGSRSGIPDTRAKSRPGAGSRASPANVARRSFSKVSSSFIG